jgi:DNA polymerase I
MSNVLLIDGMSVFMQMWHSFSCYDHKGVQSNGVGGFLNIIGNFIDEIKPLKVFIIWDTGPSRHRRNINNEYKKRKFKRSQSDIQSRTRQIAQTIKILKDTPVCQIYINGCESVDIIAYLCKTQYNKYNKVIVSTNKNLYQLIDEKIRCFSPIKRLYITKESIRNEFRIFSKNFAVANSLCGDVSTNVKGIKGLGFVRLSKMFPSVQDRKIKLSEIYQTSKNMSLKNKLYSKIYMNFTMIQDNWNLIQLENATIDNEQISQIDDIIKQHSSDFEHQKLLISLAKTQLPINHEKLIESMFYLFENGTQL